MQYKKTFFKSPLLILFILILFHGINNYIWLKLDSHPPIDDEAFHLVSSLEYLNIISRPSFDMFLKLVRVDNFYPPLFPLIASCFALVFGRSDTVFVMTNVLFLFGTFVCLYFIGLKMGDRRLGILASCFLSLYPMFFHLSRMFMLEVALYFMVVASITVLIYSEGFKKTNMSILFGVLLGLGLLTKQSYIFFIIGPWIFLLLDSLFNSNLAIRKKTIKNLFLSFIVGTGISSWWYVPNARSMLPLAVAAATDPLLVPHDIPVFSSRSFFFYLDMLINEQILLFFFLVFISSIILIVSKRKKDKFFFLFSIWIMSTYLIRTLIKNKFWYYTAVYLPAVACISAYGIMNIQRRFLRRTIILLILVIGFFQFFVVSYANLEYIEPFFNVMGLKVRVFPWGMRRIIGVKYSPQEKDWKIDAIISLILKESGGKKPVLGVPDYDADIVRRTGGLLRNNYIGVDYDCLRYYFKLKNIPYKIILLRDLSSDKSGDKVNFIVAPDILENINVYGLKKEHYFLLREFLMPDRSKVYLYKSQNIDTYRLNYTRSINKDYKESSARIDVYSEDMKFTLKEVKSNGVAQFADWLPRKQDKTKNWITQMELNTNDWQQLWIEFTATDTGFVYLVLRGSLYPDKSTNRHEVYVDDVVIEGAGVMVKNGSFEEQDNRDNPIGWGIPLASISQYVDLAHSGDYSMIVWHDSPLVQKIPVKAGIYRISAWFKAYN